MRHPIYTGLILSTLGWSLLIGSIVGLGLAASYPEYPAYRSRTKKLIPWVY